MQVTKSVPLGIRLLLPNRRNLVKTEWGIKGGTQENGGAHDKQN